MTMTADDPDTPASAPTPSKRCFVVSAFGATVEARKRTQQVLTHLVRKVLVPRGYNVVRADEIHAPGLITHQIIEHLIDADLVIADLTGNNPNVFYEIAVRHAARKPIVHLLTHGEAIPFDLKDVRTVFYALDDPDLLEAAQVELGEKVSAIEVDPNDVANPVAAVRDLRLLQTSDRPETRNIGEVLVGISELRDDLRSLSRRIGVIETSTTFPALYAGIGDGPALSGGGNMGQLMEDRILTLLETTSKPLTLEAISDVVGFSPSAVEPVLRDLADRRAIHLMARDRWMTGP
jgi:hypothetical protein